MKTSGIMTFIFMIILGLAELAMGMSMETVLKSSVFYIAYGFIVVILAAVILITCLLNKSSIFALANVVSIIASITGLIVSRILSAADYKIHPVLLEKNDLSLMILFITVLFQIIFGITNSIIGFKKVKENSNAKVVY